MMNTHTNTKTQQKTHMIGKKWIAMIVAMAVFLTSFLNVPVGNEADAAAKWGGYVYITIEKVTLGQGCVVTPVKVPVYEKESLYDLFKRQFGDIVIGVDEGSYIDGIKDGGDPEGWSKNDIPKAITDAIDADDNCGANYQRGESDTLGSMDFTYYGGWLVAVNNAGPAAGMGNILFASGDNPYNDNDVIRFQFSLYGWGADTNTADPQFTIPLIAFPDKDRLIRLIADYKGDKNADKYKAAMAALNKWDATEEEVKNAADDLAALNDSILIQSLGDNVDKALGYIKSLFDNTSPAYNSEWSIFTLARGGIEDKELYTTYYKAIIDKLRELDSDSIATKVGATPKSTDNDRVILALTAIGADPSDVAGYNMLKPLADYDYAVKSGINGAVYTLLALDAGNYTIPEVEEGKTQNTRELLIDYILNNKVEDGGWNYTKTSKTSDPDMTSMVLCALAPYAVDNLNVNLSISDGLNVLDKLQKNNGGYASYGAFNAESNAQVLTALSSCGYDAVLGMICKKEDAGVLNALMSFMKDDGSFAHAIEGASNAMASYQSTYALVAYDRLKNNKNSLYNMTDVTEPMYNADEIAAYVKGSATSEPSSEPSTSPSADPTGEPTSGPTTSPTAVPTSTPTAEPSAVPTSVPTAVPTAQPTAVPTAEPTLEPTAEPTAVPTSEPTKEPSVTEAPKTTDVPNVTNAPVATSTPIVTASPAATDTEQTPKSFIKGNIKYKVTSSKAGKFTASVIGVKNKNCKKIVINSYASYKGKKYKITKIAAGFVKGCKKLKDVYIKALYIKTIDKNAFKGTNKKLKVHVPKNKEDAYKKKIKL